MKQFYLTISLILTAITLHSQTVWDNFEDIRKCNYGFINGTFIPYFENPDQSGANTSLVSAQYTRNAAETFDVLIFDAPMASVSDYVAGTKQMSIAVWSPVAPKTVQITLENSIFAQPTNYPVGRHSEYTATITQANQWQIITFNFINRPDVNVPNTAVDRLVLLFDPNSNNNTTYYFDNLMGPEFTNDPCPEVSTNPAIINDFECNQNVNFIFSHSGVNFQREINPNTVNNTSSHAARYVRNGGEENDVIIGRFSAPINLLNGSTIALDVLDVNAPSTVVLSLQNLEDDVIIEMTANTVAGSNWQTITFDASEVAAATDIEQFVILFEPGTSSSNTFYFDNFRFDSPTNVTELSKVEKLKAFPNPVKDILNLSFNASELNNANINILDVTGKKVKSLKVNPSMQGEQVLNINLSDLPSGIYFYQITSSYNQINGKLIKE